MFKSLKTATIHSIQICIKYIHIYLREFAYNNLKNYKSVFTEKIKIEYVFYGRKIINNTPKPLNGLICRHVEYS